MEQETELHMNAEAGAVPELHIDAEAGGAGVELSSEAQPQPERQREKLDTDGLVPGLVADLQDEAVDDSDVQYFGSVPKGDVIPGCLSLADAETAVVWALMVGLGYACLWCLFQEAAEPGGWLFTLLAVFGSGTVGGMIFSRIPLGSVKMPGLVGMLVLGFVIRNAWPAINEGNDKKINSSLRNLALAIIMIKAGLGLPLDNLMKLKWTMAFLSTVPAFIEATAVCLISMALFDFDIKWGYMLGFMLADVSPAVTVPLLGKFMALGRSRKNGVPDILLFGGALNSVFAICCYGIVQGFNFSGSGTPIYEVIIRGIGDVIGGVFSGWLTGYIICKVGKNQSSFIKFSLTFVMGTMQIFAYKQDPIKTSGGNALATLIMALTIANESLGGWPKEHFEGMEGMFKLVWSLVGECTLFSLLGASMSKDDLGGETVLKGLVVIYGALIFRAAAAVATVSLGTTMDGMQWTVKEKIFTAITWCPKATVQAALSAVAITYVIENPAEFSCVVGNTTTTDCDTYKTAYQNATDLKTIAILSIIATAPLFAAAMDWGGHNLLTAPEDEEIDNDQDKQEHLENFPVRQPDDLPVLAIIDHRAVGADDLSGPESAVPAKATTLTMRERLKTSPTPYQEKSTRRVRQQSVFTTSSVVSAPSGGHYIQSTHF